MAAKERVFHSSASHTGMAGRRQKQWVTVFSPFQPSLVLGIGSASSPALVEVTWMAADGILISFLHQGWGEVQFSLPPGIKPRQKHRERLKSSRSSQVSVPLGRHSYN